MNTQFIAIDEAGFLIVDESRIENQEHGNRFLSKLTLQEDYTLTAETDATRYIVEAFDEPLIAHKIFIEPLRKKMIATFNYNYLCEINLQSLCVDEWDRFHGRTAQNVPFVMNKNAQNDFFSLVESFDDTQFTLDGKNYPTPDWLSINTELGDENSWDKLYTEKSTPWNAENASVIFQDMLERMKISKSRVLILGSGHGHDAAYFAQKGHLVTAVDFSKTAIMESKDKYGKIAGLNFVKADLFNFPTHWIGQFDLVIEHTCYCAISPDKRNELVKIWRQALHSQGHLMAIFFVMDHRIQPPYGGSEWEIRKRLQKYFQFLFWSRAKNSIAKRLGKELFVYAKKKET